MEPFGMVAQLIGIVAMAFNILSYQQKTPIRVFSFQVVGQSLFAVNFFMLGAVVGGIMNIIAAFRSVVYLFGKRFKSGNILWVALFTVLYFVSYILTFAVFGKEFTLLGGVIELLPVIAMTLSGIAMRMNSAAKVRRFGLVCSTCWLVYNIVNFALGAIICEVMSLVSIVIGILRHDIKRK